MAKNKIKKKRKIEIKKKRKEQIDVLWLVLIVMLLIILVSLVTQKYDIGEDKENLMKEAKNILNILTDGREIGFAPNNMIEEEKLEKFLDMDYSELKKNLNVKNDFCIYFEDERGNLVEVKKGIKGIGSGIIELNGEPCGK